jgi:hypothetical protein
MTDPAEVRASLLRGDSRDGCARRLAVLTDAPDRCEAFGGIRTTPAEDFAEAMKAAEADDAARTCPTCGYDCSPADHAEVDGQKSRASTFERLANVERLLAEAMGEGRTQTSVAAADDGEVAEALAIVRALLGGQ